MKMPTRILPVLCVVALVGVGCRRGGSQVLDSRSNDSSGAMIVEEVCSISQGYHTEGKRVTVRGSLNAPETGSYALFNSRWDPFDPAVGKDIPRIALRFRKGENPDERLGWYVDVTGVISTLQEDDGRIAVTLKDAVIEPVPAGDGSEMVPRKQHSQGDAEQQSKKLISLEYLHAHQQEYVGREVAIAAFLCTHEEGPWIASNPKIPFRYSMKLVVDRSSVIESLKRRRWWYQAEEGFPVILSGVFRIEDRKSSVDERVFHDPCIKVSLAEEVALDDPRWKLGS